MRRGINYIRVSISLDEESLARLKEMARTLDKPKSLVIRELIMQSTT